MITSGSCTYMGYGIDDGCWRAVIVGVALFDNLALDSGRIVTSPPSMYLKSEKSAGCLTVSQVEGLGDLWVTSGRPLSSVSGVCGALCISVRW